jgi:hypothetical protein
MEDDGAQRRPAVPTDSSRQPGDSVTHIGAPYEPAIWPTLPVTVVRTAALIFGIALLLVLLIAVHPWTFGSTPSYSPTDQYSGLFGSTTTTQPYVVVSTQSSSDTTTPTDTTSSADQIAQASSVTAILDRTKADRAEVVAAVQDAASCGSNLAGDVQALQNSQSDRQSLAQSANQLDVGALSGASAVPAELSTALNDSATADGDFASWATDLQQSCNTGSVMQDSNYQAAKGASKTADQDKQTFLNTWNPIAQQYGQETLSPSDI